MSTSDSRGRGADAAAFVHEVTLDHPVDAVWRAITRKSLVDRYYLAPLAADINAVGDAVRYGPPDHALISGIVLAFEAPRRLSHSFRFAEEADTSDTVVVYSLTPAGTGSRLRIEHHGYAKGSQGYADIAGGWPIIAEGLKKVLDRTK